MGGGDLNLKKSWHPHTMKNQEKVWKAEQAKNQEEKKLSDLRKEIQDEKNRDELKRMGEASGLLPKSDGDKKLEWMYKNSTELINRDEYLLGRTVDKSFEILQAEEQRKEQNNSLGMKKPLNHVEHECIPFSIRAYRNLESTEQVDLQRKVMEDPLMLIKQREMESRRKLLENPVKLKELHRILKTDKVLKKSKKDKKSKKSKKSKKKHKKRSKSSSSSDSDSEDDSDSGKDLDKELEKRYKKLKGTLLDKEENMAGLNLTKLLDAKYDTISKELDKAVESKRRPKKSHRSRSSSTDDRAKRNDRRERHLQRSRTPQQIRFTRRDDHEQRRQRRTRSRTRSPPRHAQHERTAYKRQRSRTRSPLRHSQRERTEYRRPRSRSPTTRHTVASASYSRKESEKTMSSATVNKKLSDAEKEARRREMMENASWREADRTKAVQKHRDANAREEEQSRSRDFDKDFLNKEVKKAFANQTSVGSRIRANLNNIQRTSAAMNANFAKR